MVEESIKDLQDYLTNLMFGIYLEVDKDNPENDDNSATYFNIDQINNYFQGTCIKLESSYDIAGTSPNGFSGTVYFKYDLHINPWNKEFISNLEFLGGDQFLQENVDNTYYLSLWDKFDECTYGLNFKPELFGGKINLNYDVNNFLQTYSITKNDFNYVNCADGSWTAPYYAKQTSNIAIVPWNVEYSLHDSPYSFLQGKYVTVNWHNAPARPDTGDYFYQHVMTSQFPAVMITDNPQINNTVNNYYTGDTITTNNYIDSSNNTYNIKNGDNFITVAPVIPAGGLVNFNLNFDDLIGGLQLAIDDINIRNGLSGGDALYIPTYQDYKYSDYSDFYIEPLHQYDKLPAAPSFDGSIELGDIPKVIGESANSYLGLLGAGMSALLCGCFITALIVQKLGR